MGFSVLVISCTTLISLYFALFGLVVTDFRLIDDGLELELSSAIVFCKTEEPAAASLICCCCCCCWFMKMREALLLRALSLSDRM